MIKFKILVMKADTNELYAIFLLKKNIQVDIIKMILEYLPIAVPEMLKEWKVAITSVEQDYKSTESKDEYRTGIRITYKRRGIPIDIGKSKDNFDKDGKLKCFNCNIYRHIANS